MPGGRLSTLDFHALPFDGGVLLDRMSVEYGMDLPKRPSSLKKPTADVLLIVDPGRNLPHAAAEGNAVQQVLEGFFADGSLIRLDHGGAELETVVDLLPGVGLLHFAGHGDFSGSNGWDSGLALAGQSRLTVPHLLTLGSVPLTVVLSACETAATDDGWAEGLGLARAFVLAGAQQVVGAARPVSDTASKTFSESLYAHWDGKSNIAEAARAAQLELRDKDLEWKSFRVVVR